MCGVRSRDGFGGDLVCVGLWLGALGSGVGAVESAGYLWGVGRNHARRIRGLPTPIFREVEVADSAGLPWFEPALPVALSRLTERQRVSVLLIHGLGWTHAEVADLLGLTVPTVQKHAQRGLVRLRREMGIGP